MLSSPTIETDLKRKSSDQQLNRACEACRLSKVRCLANPDSTSTQCQRCAKAGRGCVFIAPVKRRQRKRTDVRVAELEREVQQMRSLLNPSQVSPPVANDYDNTEEPIPQLSNDESPHTMYTQTNEAIATPETADNLISGNGEHSNQWTEPYKSNYDGPKEPLPDLDIIDQGLISLAAADELLNVYRDELTYQFPGVVIPKDWTASQLRAKKSALFHAVMMAASHSKGAALSNRLHEELIHLLARSLFIRGEKSLQYIQALIITVAFYTPPKTPSQLQIYQYINMAASMALELGLASKPRTHEQLPKRAIRSLQRISSAEELSENCRTILVLYVLTAGFAMRLRRPYILVYNSWMEECLCLLQKSNILDDKRVVAWLKLQRIADEANTAFGFDDASTSFSLSELRLQAILRVFERRMLDWRKSVPNEIMTSASLMIEWHQNMISNYEFAMDGGNYDAPDFRNRHLTLPALDDDCVQPESLLSRSALQINATIKCIGSAQSLLDCFTQFSPERLQKAPNVLFVRAIYALVALMKADYAVGTDAQGMGEVLDSKSLKVEYYLTAVLQKTSAAIGPRNCRVPSHWHFVLTNKLKSWHDEYEQWKRDGKHLDRKCQADVSVPTTYPIAATSTKLHDNGPSQSLPKPDTSSTTTTARATPQHHVPGFALNGAYTASWPTTALNIPDIESSEELISQPTFAEMGDFAAAFQNGDLYLWNDVNETFGGWIPQGGSIYSDVQFATNEQGL
ncbi:hypothetical protein B0J11DRAFT_233390 [Dendryphion nanum]|uniref:Zn(2)-C6 fungal-type domain-containing protein n=1 Tax=Dendryphion nanum TaxID=256645 RepID=A0A9P9E588_9PLEO|nr:hypothetical protein B0J11DRAFT_233390 [Dendryphion nanum]